MIRTRFLPGMILVISMFVFQCESLWAETPPDLPFWSADKGDNGKYGFFDASGKCVIPYVLDGLEFFTTNSSVIPVKYEGKYYLINRKGFLVTGESYKYRPAIVKNCIEISKDDEGQLETYLIDYNGKRLSPKGTVIKRLYGSPDSEVPVLYEISKVGGMWRFLTDMNFSPLSDVPTQGLSYVGPADLGLLSYHLYNGLARHAYGLMNAAGEVLVEASEEYTRFSTFQVSDYPGWKELIYKSGLNWLHSPEEIDEMGEMLLVRAGSGKTETVFDITGKIIIPERKFKNPSKSDFKKYLVRYLYDMPNNSERIAKKITEPYERAKKVRDEVCRTLPWDTRSELSLAVKIEDEKAVRLLEEAKTSFASSSSASSKTVLPSDTRSASSSVSASSSATSKSASAGVSSSSQTSSSTRSSSSGNIVKSHENFDPVLLPPYGTMPGENRTFCYVNDKGQLCKIIMTVSDLGVFISFSPYVITKSTAALSGETADEFIFSAYTYNTMPVKTGWGTYTPNVSLIFGQQRLTISKDWKKVRIYSGAYEFDMPITEADYNRFLKAKEEYYKQLEAAFGGGGMSGGTAGGSGAGVGNGSGESRYGYYTCPNCHGSGRCPHCDGKGLARNSYLGGEAMLCSPCNGRGKCASCDGTGKKYGVVR